MAIVRAGVTCTAKHVNQIIDYEMNIIYMRFE